MIASLISATLAAIRSRYFSTLASKAASSSVSVVSFMCPPARDSNLDKSAIKNKTKRYYAYRPLRPSPCVDDRAFHCALRGKGTDRPSHFHFFANVPISSRLRLVSGVR